MNCKIGDEVKINQTRGTVIEITDTDIVIEGFFGRKRHTLPITSEVEVTQTAYEVAQEEKRYEARAAKRAARREAKERAEKEAELSTIPWQQHPATDRQISYLVTLGVEINGRTLTKGEASDLITAAKAGDLGLYNEFYTDGSN